MAMLKVTAKNNRGARDIAHALADQAIRYGLVADDERAAVEWRYYEEIRPAPWHARAALIEVRHA
jgi:hypothetical protein